MSARGIRGVRGREKRRRCPVISKVRDSRLESGQTAVSGYMVYGLVLYLMGCSTAGWLVTATKRSIAHNATSGRAPPPRAWSIETGQCSGTWRPPGAVFVPRQRDQEAARSNRREGPSSVLVTSQWCAQEGDVQPARTPWPPRRQHSQGSS